MLTRLEDQTFAAAAGTSTQNAQTRPENATKVANKLDKLDKLQAGKGPRDGMVSSHSTLLEQMCVLKRYMRDGILS